MKSGVFIRTDIVVFAVNKVSIFSIKNAHMENFRDNLMIFMGTISLEKESCVLFQLSHTHPTRLTLSTANRKQH